MNFDVVTANLHVVSKHQMDGVKGIVRYVRPHFERRPDVIACQEGIQIQTVKRVGRYQVITTNHRDKHDNTNVILIKKRFQVLTSVWHFGAPAFGHELNHHRRHWHEVTFLRKQRTYAVLDAHLSVVPEQAAIGKDLGQLSPLLRTHAVMAANIADRADQLVKEGVIVTVCADGNVANNWKLSLIGQLKSRNYLIMRHGLDFVAVHRSQAKVRESSVVVPESVTHSDHEALAAAFVLEE